MIDLGIDIGKEAVFPWDERIPEGPWLLADKLNAHKRFEALKTVLPGHDQADRRPVLVGHFVTINSRGYKSEFVCRFFNRQSFNIGPGPLGIVKTVQ